MLNRKFVTKLWKFRFSLKVVVFAEYFRHNVAQCVAVKNEMLFMFI